MYIVHPSVRGAQRMGRVKRSGPEGRLSVASSQRAARGSHGSGALASEAYPSVTDCPSPGVGYVGSLTSSSAAEAGDKAAMFCGGMIGIFPVLGPDQTRLAWHRW